jgi:hypothetical protein
MKSPPMKADHDGIGTNQKNSNTISISNNYRRKEPKKTSSHKNLHL